MPDVLRKVAASAVEAIIDDLRDRAGLSDEWDDTDVDIQAEIRWAWEQAIVTAFASALNEQPRSDKQGLTP